MATTYLTIGSKFQPYTLSEMLVPYQMYKDEYQRQEDLYNTYAETAGLIGADLNPELDSDILEKTYNPYMEALNSSASALSSQGLTSGGRKTLQELRRRFGREITPIKVASEARAKARENWDKMLAQDKTLMTNANPYYKGVSAYMNGASPDTTYVSGNELYSRGQALSKALASTLRNVPEDEVLAMLGQYWRVTSDEGFDPDAAKRFMEGEYGAIPELANQIEGILQNSGIYNDGFSQLDRNKAMQYVIEGMKSGISGETKVNYLKTDFPVPSGTGNPPEVPAGPVVGKVPFGINPSTFKEYNKAAAFRDKVYNEYTPIEFEGTEYMVPGVLKEQLQYASNPELRKEYDKKRDDLYSKLVEKYRSLNPNLSYPEVDAIVRPEVNRTYPALPSERAIKRQLKKVQEENAAILGRYGHLSMDQSKALRWGAALDAAQLSEPTGAYTFKYDPTYVNKVKEDMKNSPYKIYSYDRSTASVGKEIAPDKVRGLVENGIGEVYRDYNGRTIISMGGKEYYMAGDTGEQLKQRQIQALRASFSYFGNDGEGLTISNVNGNIHIPGIGTYDERTDVSSKELQHIMDYDFSNKIEDGTAKPVTSGGDILFYRLALNNVDTGIPYVVTISPSGSFIAISDAVSAGIGGTPFEDKVLESYAGMSNEESGVVHSRKPGL